jgi:hypothetical protein
MIGGRLFGVTDPGRYVSTDAIDNPIMALEYIKRNQNWSDNSETPLIRTGAIDGSFDDSSLAEIEALSISRQINEEDQQWTESISKSLCEAFYLVSRQDSDGYECVYYLLSTEVPDETIDIADIIPGSLGKIIEPAAENIYTEPFISYAYDYATSKFIKSLRIDGVSENSEWSSALTPGFQNNDGEALWNICRTNYLKYGRIEKIPSSISDQHWIPDYSTALWKITKMIEWQSKKRFSFSVYYTKGRLWNDGKQINIQFPNETNNQTIVAVINKINKNKSDNKVTISLTLLTDVLPSFYFDMYQATDGSAVTWQPTDDTGTLYQEAG